VVPTELTKGMKELEIKNIDAKLSKEAAESQAIMNEIAEERKRIAEARECN
jgi:hypothetical protein